MRGTSDQQIESLVALTPRTWSLANTDPADQAAGRPGASGVVAHLQPHVRQERPAISAARTPAEGELADRALLRALGAPVLRTADLRHALPVVSRPEHPGRFLRPVDVRQEPDPAVGA